MAEEVLYGSKRKYNDNAASLPPSYNTVPPPSACMDEIQLSKQKAQEIVARLFKQPCVDTADSNNDVGVKPVGGYPPMSSSFGYATPSRMIQIPSSRFGVIMGKGEETIKYLQLQAGAKIQVTRDMDVDPYSQSRSVELMGTAEQIAKAEQLINDDLVEAEAAGYGLASRRITGQQSGGAEQFTMKILNNKVGLVIGKGGETIESMQATTCARIQLYPRFFVLLLIIVFLRNFNDAYCYENFVGVHYLLAWL